MCQTCRYAKLRELSVHIFDSNTSDRKPKLINQPGFLSSSHEGGNAVAYCSSANCMGSLV